MGTADDGRFSWPHRKERTLQVIRDLDADIIGLQEVLDFQLDFLAEGLPDYRWVGVGREDGERAGEFAPVFYRPDRVALRDWKTVWMSETPDVVNSMSWNTACTRIATVVDFEGLRILNTHWDHISAKARLNSSRLCLSLAPDILMGDLNAAPSDPEIMLLSGAPNMRAIIDDRKATYHGFGQIGVGSTIDYIFVNSSKLELKGCDVVDEPTASDHHPVVATLQFK